MPAPVRAPRRSLAPPRRSAGPGRVLRTGAPPRGRDAAGSTDRLIASSIGSLPLYKTANESGGSVMASTEQAVETETARSRSWPGGTCGCTSRGCRRYDDGRDPDHRPRRGLLRLRRARQPLPRRALGAVLREHRPRPRRHRPGRRRPGQGARLLHQLVLRAPAARSSSPRGSPRWPPATSTACSSPAAAARRSSRRCKLARQYHKLTGKPNKNKVIAREIAYHGTSLGALSATGITGLREPFEPLTPGGCHVPNTNTYRMAAGMQPRRTSRRRSPSGSSSRARTPSPR